MFILHHHLNGLGNKNLYSIQDVMRARNPAAEKSKRVCEDFPNLAILTKSATPSKIQLTFGHAAVVNNPLGESVVAFALARNLSSPPVIFLEYQNHLYRGQQQDLSTDRGSPPLRRRWQPRAI